MGVKPIFCASRKGKDRLDEQGIGLNSKEQIDELLAPTVESLDARFGVLNFLVRVSTVCCEFILMKRINVDVCRC